MQQKDECWNIRPVRNKDYTGQGQSWVWQAARYSRSTRRDGFPIWKFVEDIAPPRIDEDKASSDGENSGLDHDPYAKHNGISLRLSDVLTPDEETLCRLASPDDFVLLIGPARNEARRIVGVAHAENGATKFLRRVCSCSKGQTKIFFDLASTFGMAVALVDSVPRLPGKVLKIDDDNITRNTRRRSD